MLKVFDKNSKKQWNEIVRTFSNWDIYYLFEYANSFSIHGDGEPLLLYFEENGKRMCYQIIKRNISKDYRFEGLIEDKYYDATITYGYGGPLLDGEFNDEDQKSYINDLNNYCKDNNIVSLFFRFHPLLGNQNCIDKVTTVQYVHDTIVIDTSSQEIIDANMDPKQRRHIRKAINNNVTIEVKPISEYKDFMDIYNQTMLRLEAAGYYFFDEAYYKSLIDMKENACIFYAKYEGKTIAGSIILYNEQYMHYHLSGSLLEYRNLPATSLLLYEASKWACKKGIKQLHLGGGLNAEDSLYKYKLSFNRNGSIPFYIGSNIFDKEAYEYLKQVRKENDPAFDPDNTNLIQYRK